MEIGFETGTRDARYGTRPQPKPRRSVRTAVTSFGPSTPKEGYDRTTTYGATIDAMGSHPRIRSLVRTAVVRVARATLAAVDRNDAVTGGHRSDSVGMRIRQFHNVLGLHRNDLCFGSLFRSAGILASERDGTLEAVDVRCEHVVPASILAGVVWDRFRGAPPRDLAGFLLRRTFVAAVTCAEDGTMIGLPRSYEGWSERGWKHQHPEYEDGLDVLRGDLRPFLRYHGTGIGIRFMPTGRTIDLGTYTVADHVSALAGLPLYDPDRYFDVDEALPATD